MILLYDFLSTQLKYHLLLFNLLCKTQSKSKLNYEKPAKQSLLQLLLPKSFEDLSIASRPFFFITFQLELSWGPWVQLLAASLLSFYFLKLPIAIITVFSFPILPISLQPSIRTIFLPFKVTNSFQIDHIMKRLKQFFPQSYS